MATASNTQPGRSAAPAAAALASAPAARPVDAARVEAQLTTIKAHMPETYKLIQTWALEIGNEAFRYVRRGCSGEPDCFWACEAGYVVGTPFNMQAISDDVARYMVRFGCTFVALRADGRGDASKPVPQGQGGASSPPATTSPLSGSSQPSPIAG